MSEKETVIQVPEVEANDTSAPEKSGVFESEDKTKEINVAKDGEETKNDEEKSNTEKMDEEPMVQDYKTNEEKEKEEARADLMEEETSSKTDDIAEDEAEAKKNSVNNTDGSIGEEEKKEDDDVEGNEDSKEEMEKKPDESNEKEEKKGEKDLEGNKGSKEDMEKKIDGSKEEVEKKRDEDVDDMEETKKDIDEETVISKDERAKVKDTMEQKGTKVGRKEKTAGEKVEKKKKAEEKEPEFRTPASDRPQRERKSVERLVASMEKDASKEFLVEKGFGTQLKDIPNIAFKLSRRKNDDLFKLLHSILFGRRGKASQIKSNISRFSGFVWHGNEEKQKTKVGEKFDKFNKEKLLEFCDFLDIPISKATAKEDIVAKLVDFLMSPHITSTVLLAEEKAKGGSKRKRMSKSPTSGSMKSSAKSQRTFEDTLKTRKRKRNASDTEDELEEEKDEEEDEGEEVEEENIEENENGIREKFDSDIPEHSENEEENKSEKESEEDTRNHKRTSKASSRKKESTVNTKPKKISVLNKSSFPPKKTPRKSSSKLLQADDDSDASPKVSSRKKRSEKVHEKPLNAKKSANKDKAGKIATTEKEKTRDTVEKLKPGDEDLREAICEILKEVDFNTATFTDILKLLARRFDTDLTPRKASIKLMIQEELTKLADEADGEDEDEVEKNETQPSVQEGEA